MKSSEGLYSRRSFLATGLAAAAAEPSQVAGAGSPPFHVDYAKLLAPAGLLYEKPVARSEEGIPVGNGNGHSRVDNALVHPHADQPRGCVRE